MRSMRKRLRNNSKEIIGASLIVAVLAISFVFGFGLVGQTVIENPPDDETTTTETTTTTEPTTPTTTIPDDSNIIVVGIVIAGAVLTATIIITLWRNKSGRRKGKH